MRIVKPTNGDLIDAECLFSEEFTNKVNFNESYVSENTHFIKIGKMVLISFQGESKTHSNNTTVFTLPQGYRPSGTYMVPFIKNSNTFGIMEITSEGRCSVNQIGSNSAYGRLYFNCCYFTD